MLIIPQLATQSKHIKSLIVSIFCRLPLHWRPHSVLKHQRSAPITTVFTYVNMATFSFLTTSWKYVRKECDESISSSRKSVDWWRGAAVVERGGYRQSGLQGPLGVVSATFANYTQIQSVNTTPPALDQENLRELSVNSIQVVKKKIKINLGFKIYWSFWQIPCPWLSSIACSFNAGCLFHLADYQ